MKGRSPAAVSRVGALLLLILCGASVANASSRSLLAAEKRTATKKSTASASAKGQDRQDGLILLLLAKWALQQQQQRQQQSAIAPGARALEEGEGGGKRGSPVRWGGNPRLRSFFRFKRAGDGQRTVRVPKTGRRGALREDTRVSPLNPHSLLHTHTHTLSVCLSLSTL